MPLSTDIQVRRRDAIRRLLASGPARTQHKLVQALEAEGFEATQSSISRDLKELGAIKTAAGYMLPDAGNGAVDDLLAVSDLLRQIAPAGPNLLVIRTAIGAAQRVALALDRAALPEIVGSLGGDDTVFVATASRTAQRTVETHLQRAANGSGFDAGVRQ